MRPHHRSNQSVTNREKPRLRHALFLSTLMAIALAPACAINSSPQPTNRQTLASHLDALSKLLDAKSHNALITGLSSFTKAGTDGLEVPEIFRAPAGRVVAAVNSSHAFGIRVSDPDIKTEIEVDPKTGELARFKSESYDFTVTTDNKNTQQRTANIQIVRSPMGWAGSLIMTIASDDWMETERPAPGYRFFSDEVPNPEKPTKIKIELNLDEEKTKSKFAGNVSFTLPSAKSSLLPEGVQANLSINGYSLEAISHEKNGLFQKASGIIRTPLIKASREVYTLSFINQPDNKSPFQLNFGSEQSQSEIRIRARPPSTQPANPAVDEASGPEGSTEPDASTTQDWTSALEVTLHHLKSGTKIAELFFEPSPGKPNRFHIRMVGASGETQLWPCDGLFENLEIWNRSLMTQP